MSESGSKLKQRVGMLKQPVEEFVKNFEWTWTSAITFSIAMTFFIWITMAVMPSFWLYTADTQLKWNGAGSQQILGVTLSGFWLKQLRDIVVMGIATTPFIVLLIVTPAMQNWRRKLRGAQSDTRPSGGYR